MSGYKNAAPFEIMSGPVDVWVAPTGTAFPLVSAAPAVAWVKLGTSGSDNITEDGVTVSQPQSVAGWRSLKSTGIRKMFRQSEDLMIKMNLADVSAENYTLAFEGNTITTTVAASAIPGTKKFGLSRGPQVAQHALLVRGPSPYADAMAQQYEVPIVSLVGSPEIVYKKGTPAYLAFEFQALEDPGASSDAERFGRLVQQTAAPLP